MFFSPYIADIDVFNGIGYCFCGLLFFHLLVNIVIIGYETVTEKRKQFRKWLIIRRELKKVKKLRTSAIRDQLRQEKQKFVKRRISVWNKDQNDLIMNLQRSQTRRRSMALILDDEDEKNKKRLFAMKLAGNNRRRLLAQLDAIEESEEQQSSDTESVSSSVRNQIQQAKNDSQTLNEIEEEEMVRVKPFMKTAKKQRSNAKQDGIEDIYIDKSLTIAKEIPFDEEKANELEEWYSKRLNKFREKHGVKAKIFSPMKYKLSLGNLLEHIEDERTQLYNSTIEEQEEKGVTKRPQQETKATHESAEATKEPTEKTKEGPSELKNPVNANFKDLGKQQKVFKRQNTRKQTFKALNTKAQTSRNQTNNSPDLKRKITLKETIKQTITRQETSKLDSHPTKVEPRPKPVMTFRNLRQSKTFREKCENVGFKPVQYKLDEMLENIQKERTQDYETTLEEEVSCWDVAPNHKNALVDIQTHAQMKEDVNDRELWINVKEMQVEQAEESKSPAISSRVINILKNIQCANFEEPGKQQMLIKRNITRIQPFKTQDSLPEIIKPNPAQSHRWFDKHNTLFLPQVVTSNALPMSGLAISQLGPSIRQLNSQTSRNKSKELIRPSNTVDKIRLQRLQLNSSKESLNLIDSTPDAIAVYQPAPPRKGRKLVLNSQLTHQIARKMRQKEKLSRSLEVQTERAQDRDKWYEQKSLTRHNI